MQTSNFNISYFFFYDAKFHSFTYPGANDKLASFVTESTLSIRINFGSMDGDVLHAQSQRLVCSSNWDTKRRSPIRAGRKGVGGGDVMGARRKQLPTRLLRARLIARRRFSRFFLVVCAQMAQCSKYKYVWAHLRRRLFFLLIFAFKAFESRDIFLENCLRRTFLNKWGEDHLSQAKILISDMSILAWIRNFSWQLFGHH